MNKNFYYLKNISVLHSSPEGISIAYKNGGQKYLGFVSPSSLNKKRLEVIIVSGNPRSGLCIVKPKDGYFVQRNGLLVDSEHLS